jgi:purine-binding chemotaxis protein CheW
MAGSKAIVEIVAFDLGRLRCGLIAADVERVLRAVAMTPLPNAPAVIEGLISIAGSPVAVVDIRKRLGLRPKSIDLADVLIVTRAGDRRVAIRADRAAGVIKVAAADIHDATAVGPMAAQVVGVATLPDGIILIHDPRAFLTQAEAADLAGLTLEMVAS